MHKIRSVLPIVFACFLFALFTLAGWHDATAAPPPRVALAARAASAVDDTPPQRSTRFDFASRITYAADARFNRNAAMTVEPWVYPERNFDDPEGCQSFVEHQLGTSY